MISLLCDLCHLWAYIKTDFLD